MIDDLQEMDPWEYLNSALRIKGRKRINYWGKASVFCRLIDSQREVKRKIIFRVIFRTSLIMKGVILSICLLRARKHIYLMRKK